MGLFVGLDCLFFFFFKVMHSENMQRQSLMVEINPQGIV